MFARLGSRPEQAAQLKKTSRSRTFTLRVDIAAHAIDEVDEARIGSHLLRQDRIALEERVVAEAAVVRTLEPLERGILVGSLQRALDPSFKHFEPGQQPLDARVIGDGSLRLL